MRIGPKAAVLLYTGLLFAALPVLPQAVAWSNARLGRGVALLPAGLALAAAAGLLALRLARTRRPAPWPHLGLAGIGAAALGAGTLLVSSPIGLVHLPEYGLLAVLACRALGAAAGPLAAGPLAGGATAAAIGLLDESAQLAVPNRYFDWWDVALNAAGAAVGALAFAWWRWTGEERPGPAGDVSAARPAPPGTPPGPRR